MLTTSQWNKTQMLPDNYSHLYVIQGVGLLCLDAHSPAGVSKEVWLGGLGLASVAHIAGQGSAEGQNHPSPSKYLLYVDWQLLTR